MKRLPGQISGHVDGSGFAWAEYVAWLVETHGSLAKVALALADRARRGESPESIERALRRLRDSDGDGGSYGARLVRTFGLPKPVAARTAWMGLYHSRFCDLPVPLCLEILRVWDRPPITTSADGAFIALGLAHTALRAGDRDAAVAHLARAATPSKKLPAAHVEHLLGSAFVASGRGDARACGALLEQAALVIDGSDLGGERAAFVARLNDQRAYAMLNAKERDLAGARALYEAIDHVGPPFARMKRAAGLAYVAWKSNELDAALREARAAVTHAGDGGLLRQRAIALGLLAHVATGQERHDAKSRAAAIAASLQDEDLLLRQARQGA